MANIADDTNLIRTATYGKDMREAIADGIEDINAEVESTTARQANVEGRQDDVEETFQEVINLGGNPSAEVVQARTDTINNITYDNLQARLNDNASHLADKQTQINNLDANKSEKTDVNNALALKANQTSLDATNTAVANNYSILDTKINSQASGSPKGTYATLTDLQTAFPTGNTNIYVVTADGKWYYWNDSAWTAGGVYQSTGIAKKSVTYDKTDFITVGKNLYDKSKRTVGYWVDYATGLLVVSAPYDTSDYIPVSQGVTYFLTKFRNYALYDSNKTYLSGVNNTAYGSATFTPTQDGYIRFATGTAYADTTQLEIGSAFTYYEKYSINIPSVIINNDNISNKILTEDKVDPNSNIALKKIGKNLINPNTLTSGHYVVYTTGALATLADYSACDFIEITPSATYTLSVQDNGTNTALEQFAFYDINKNYISGISNLGVTKNVTFTSPSNAYYVRLSLRDAYLQYYQLEQNTVKTDYESYSRLIRIVDMEKGKINSEYLASSISSQLIPKNIIVVKQDGTGDFTSLRIALESITDSSLANQYEMQIHEGTYDIMSYYTQIEIDDAGFIGLIKPDYVSLKGIGDRDKIILKGELADTFSSTTMNRVSTIVRYGNGSIENLIVTGKRLRYAVHDDYNFPNSIAETKNCHFIKYTSPTYTNYPQAYGEGCWSGTKHIFEDCYFYTDVSAYSYSFHNNTAFTKPSSHKFINCDFDNEGSTTGIAFLSMGSGQKDTISMQGCRIKGKIQLSENTAGVGCDFELTGYGNDKVPYVITVTDGLQYVYNFAGEHLKVHNGDTAIIAKGTPVKLALVANNSGVKTFTTTDDQSILLGIAFEDIAIGASGIIRIGGYLNVADTSLIGLVDGDKIGVVNGVLAKVTSGDYIGIVVWGSWIKLKI